MIVLNSWTEGDPEPGRRGRRQQLRSAIVRDQGMIEVTSGSEGHPGPGRRGRWQREQSGTIVTHSYSDAMPTVYIS